MLQNSRTLEHNAWQAVAILFVTKDDVKEKEEQ